MTLTELVNRAHATAVAKGWHDDGDPPLMEALCLVHSEVSEAVEAYRDPHVDPKRLYVCHRTGKPEGVPSELADVVIRIAHICGTEGIDLEAAVAAKLAYNETRPARHGGKRA